MRGRLVNAWRALRDKPPVPTLVEDVSTIEDHGGQWRVTVAGYDVALTAGASALVYRLGGRSGYLFVDNVPVTLSLAGGPCLWLGMESVLGAIEQLELEAGR